MTQPTPLIEQFLIIKKKYPYHFVFYQVGDFFELFFSDAEECSRLIGLTLTQKNGVPMCGIPVSQKDIYVQKLIQLNKKVVVCEQYIDNAKAIKRKITGIFTPGTSINLDKDNNFLLSFTKNGNYISTAYMDITSNECYINLIKIEDIHIQILKIQPREIICTEPLWELLQNYTNAYNIEVVPHSTDDSFELIKFYLSLNYHQIDNVKPIKEGNFMYMCENTILNLNILGKKSLLSTLDFTQTPMGYRYLKNRLLHPFLQINDIHESQTIIEYLIDVVKINDNKIKIQDIRKIVNNIKNLKDLQTICNNLHTAINLIENIGYTFNIKYQKLPKLHILKLVESNLSENGDLNNTHSRELQGTLEKLYIDLKNTTKYQIKRNNLIGFYIEVKTQQKPEEHWILKQGLVGTTRYTSRDIISIEAQIIELEEKIKNLEKESLNWFIEQVQKEIHIIYAISDLVGELDFYLGMAKAAIHFNYRKPVFATDKTLQINNGKHPILAGEMDFLPNDLNMNYDRRVLLITGPNMGGKSTYLKTNALIVIMAHCGLMVPGDVTLSLVDKIFIRIGASDNLLEGKSTFMVEMLDCSNILHNATEKSLVLIDELGRGTSTKDGMSISMAIMEYLHHKNIFTIIATHYHELSKCANYLSGFVNLHASIDGAMLTYRIVEGCADESYGLEVAKKVNLPAAIIHRANEIMSSIHITIKL